MYDDSAALDLTLPLGRWIRRNVLAPMGAPVDVEVFRYRTPSPRIVRCSVRAGGTEVGTFVMKEYYRDPNIPPSTAGIRAQREMQAFRLIERNGLHEGDNRAARLLAGRISDPATLAVQHVGGADVASLIKRAAGHPSAVQAADRALRGVGGVLARFHAIDASEFPSWRDNVRRYPARLLHTLAIEHVVSDAAFDRCMASLRATGDRLFLTPRRLVHGDANPTNFLVQPSGGVVAIDLERAGACNPALDRGFLKADVLHLVRQYRGDAGTARVLIRALDEGYREAGGRTSPEDDRLLLAIGLWRIATNQWLSRRQRRWLVDVSEGVLGHNDREAAWTTSPED